MHLYLLRHGDAVDEPGIPDRERVLSPTGKQQSDRVAQFCKRGGIRFDLILSSPLTRARETAEAVVRAGLASNISTTNVLLPTSTPSDIIAELRVQTAGNVLLVGHQPLLGNCMAHFISADGSANVEFKKGSLAHIELQHGVSAGRGMLHFLLLNDQMK